MANKLPKFIVLKSSDSGGIARYKDLDNILAKDEDDNSVLCEEGNVFSPFAKIEVEASKSHPDYVHLRFVHTNKYWARHSKFSSIVASSDQPEEDTSKLSCTLFEPTFDIVSHKVSFTHVQSGRPVVERSPSLNVDDYSTSRDDFQVVDWDTLVKLPIYVTFKGDNDKYLKGVRYNNQPYLEFGQDDLNQQSTAYEVYLHPNGHLWIKSVSFDDFWRYSPNWILADFIDQDEEDINTLFWPVKIDNRTIALRSAGNDKFCRRLTIEGKNNCLNAADENITKEARLVVEEPVLERSIYNVRYRMEDARVYDVKPFVAGEGTATNDSDEESTVFVTVSYIDTRTSSFTRTLSIEGGVTTTIEAGIPFVAEGKIEVSVSKTNSLKWGQTLETSKTMEATNTVIVPARSRAIVRCVGTEGKCSVPFSYTQRDKSSIDGSFVRTKQFDGIFYGVNYYSFRFEQLAVESL